MPASAFRRAITLLAASVALLPLGCGGGGTDDIGGTTTLTFTPSTDIAMFSDGTSANTGGLVAGDTSAGLSSRSALRFGITPFLPSGATIVSATLRLRQTGVVGSPYALLGVVVVDRADFGVSVNGSDFNPTVLTPNLGTLSSGPALGTVELDVTAAVQADLAALAFTSDFLVRFTTGPAINGTADAAQFEDSENSHASGFEPELVVEYL